MKYWIMKSEPTELSIDHLEKLPNQTIDWFGIRNYQARNFMRNIMQINDLAFFWHSSCQYPGIYGIVKIVTNAHPDATQFIANGEYYENKSTLENPRWWCVDVQFQKKLKYISISELRKHEYLQNLKFLQKGNRLSIMEITEQEWLYINNLAANS